MYKILKKKILTDNIFLMDIHAPRVAKSALPGQFVIVKVDEKGERIPLTICDYDAKNGTVTIVVQAEGASTYKMSTYEEGDYFTDFLGPLGNPSDLTDEPLEKIKNKRILFVAGGVGTAPVYPQVKWLRQNGVGADVVIGARSKDISILTDEMAEVADNVYLATNDGSSGFKGMVTDRIKMLIEQEGKHYDLVIAIGPMIMMKFVCLLTKELGIPTVVSMNPIMVDGSGMCGACRLTVGEEVKFACVDGPEFDGHLVNFDEAMQRQNLYKTEEGRALLKWKEGSTHHGGCGVCGGNANG